MFDKSSDTKKRHSIQPKARWNTDVDRGSITCLMSRRHSTPVIGRRYDNLWFENDAADVAISTCMIMASESIMM